MPISAAALGIAETVVKKQLYNLRQRYRWLLREEVAHTVENPADVDDEIRHLCAALASRSLMNKPTGPPDSVADVIENPTQVPAVRRDNPT